MGDIIGQVCGALTAGNRPILLALFVAGLGSSFTHCLVMCGGFVLGQSGGGAGRSAMSRLLLPYHAGRVTTYVILGAVAATAFYLISGWSAFSLLRHLVLSIVAVLFLGLFADRLLRRFGIVFPFRLPASCGLNTFQRLRSATGGLQRYALGLSLGLLPCPMVFAALMAAGATANPAMGGLAMLAFGIGTMPALMGLGVASGKFLNMSPRLQDGLTLAALGVNGVILLTLAVG